MAVYPCRKTPGPVSRGSRTGWRGRIPWLFGPPSDCARDQRLLTTLAGTLLRMEIDRVPLWRGNHVTVRQLVEDFACYPYLPG